MFELMNKAYSDTLDEILTARRSVKAFNGVLPDVKDIELIIRAGYRTPFAGKPSRGKKDFRRVFVIRTDSDVMAKIETLLLDCLAERNKELAGIDTLDIPNNTTAFFRNAPYLIIAAERKGYPITYTTDNSISLSYCMFGMWLKATTLKIGFKLVSAFVHAKIGNDEKFCRLIGLPCGEYALDAAVIGYPHERYKPAEVDYPDYASNTSWL
jgi:hypothetical protein